MAQVFYSGVNGNNWSEWTTEDTTGVLRFGIEASSALGGTAYGVSTNSSGGKTHEKVTYNIPLAGGSNQRLACRIKDTGIAMSGGGGRHIIWRMTTDAASETVIFGIGLADDGTVSTTPYAQGFIRDDGGSTVEVVDPDPLPSGDVTLEVRIKYATGVSDNNGELELFVNGTSKVSRADVDLFNNSVDTFGTRLHVIADGGMGGGSTYDVDEFYNRNDTTQIYPPPAGLSLADMTKPMDVDTDGSFLYIALLEGGTPILTKISTALDAAGTTVFNPGSGSNIGVECGRLNPDVVWIAGSFDGTNVVEKSEDAGTSFVVKDNAAMGAIRTFTLGPDSDEKVLVYDETNNDILETVDNGDNWTTINASITQDINDMGRLAKNTQETVFGNQGAGTNSVQYSVNSGDDLEDYQTGVYPNSNATKIIVN